MRRCGLNCHPDKAHERVFKVAHRVMANDIDCMTKRMIVILGKLLAGLLIVTAWSVPQAVAQQSVGQCVVIEDDGERLACYDSVFRDTAVAPEGAIVVQSERLIPARPTGREPATMSISCDAGNMVVSFSFAGQLVSNTGDIAALTYQVDAGGTVVRTLRANDDNTQLSFATERDTSFFLDTLVGGTNLKVRMTPVRQRSVTVDFSLMPIADDLAAMRAGCV